MLTHSISNWSICDKANHTYYVQNGFILASGERVTVYNGSGSNTEIELYWGADSAIWNNGGDMIVAIDDNGEQILKKVYSR